MSISLTSDRQMNIQLFTKGEGASLTQIRRGETKLGEVIHILDEASASSLLKAKSQGVKYLVLGIPESIGVMGNGGKPGAENAWDSFLAAFLNVQSNRFSNGEEICVLGNIDVDFLQKKAQALDKEATYYTQKLHLLCEQLDELVVPVVQLIAELGFTPIIIGGGHNNAFPILKGMSKGLSTSLNALNLDAHADFRPLEGRHSGNPFSYAMQARVLEKYAVFGLHENYNNENMLKALDSLPSTRYSFLEDLVYFGKELNASIDFVGDRKVGVELDMDALRMMPSSASSPTGFSLEQARNFAKQCAEKLDVAYLHLPEAAPITVEQSATVGKALTYLVTDFVKANKKGA